MRLEDWFCTDPEEKPLDRIAPDGGYSGILGTVGCIGDSLASGEYEVFDAEGARHCIDTFADSWGQYFARISGNKVYNFSRGGMSAKWYMESYGEEMSFWDPAKACRAYIVALGCNDFNMMKRGELEFGSIDDIDFADWRNNKPTFAGWFGRILGRYREISPKCRIFLMTLPRDADYDTLDLHRKLMYQIAERLEFTYVMDLKEYAVPYDEAFKARFFMNGHMNPMGYRLTGMMVASYIDWIIRHHPDDFVQLGMLGNRPHDAKYKW